MFSYSNGTKQKSHSKKCFVNRIRDCQVSRQHITRFSFIYQYNCCFLAERLNTMKHEPFHAAHFIFFLFLVLFHVFRIRTLYSRFLFTILSIQRDAIWFVICLRRWFFLLRRLNIEEVQLDIFSTGTILVGRLVVFNKNSSLFIFEKDVISSALFDL